MAFLDYSQKSLRAIPIIILLRRFISESGLLGFCGHKKTPMMIDCEVYRIRQRDDVPLLLTMIAMNT